MRMAGLGLGLFGVLFYLGFIALTVYCFVLYIKLATRGIKALDIYIEKSQREQIKSKDFNP